MKITFRQAHILCDDVYKEYSTTEGGIFLLLKFDSHFIILAKYGITNKINSVNLCAKYNMAYSVILCITYLGYNSMLAKPPHPCLYIVKMLVELRRGEVKNLQDSILCI